MSPRTPRGFKTPWRARESLKEEETTGYRSSARKVKDTNLSHFQVQLAEKTRSIREEEELLREHEERLRKEQELLQELKEEFQRRSYVAAKKAKAKAKRERKARREQRDYERAIREQEEREMERRRQEDLAAQREWEERERARRAQQEHDQAVWEQRQQQAYEDAHQEQLRRAEALRERQQRQVAMEELLRLVRNTALEELDLQGLLIRWADRRLGLTGNMQTMARSTQRRRLEFREGRAFTDNNSQNWREASLIYMTGELKDGENACKCCREGLGPLAQCVTGLERNIASGACSNCHSRASGKSCSFHSRYNAFGIGDS